MSSFSPSAIQQAVVEFTPKRPVRFHDLMPAKDVIAELRRKRANLIGTAKAATYEGAARLNSAEQAVYERIRQDNHFRSRRKFPTPMPLMNCEV